MQTSVIAYRVARIKLLSYVGPLGEHTSGIMSIAQLFAATSSHQGDSSLSGVRHYSLLSGPSIFVTYLRVLNLGCQYRHEAEIESCCCSTSRAVAEASCDKLQRSWRMNGFVKCDSHVANIAAVNI
jgi:hypothetical protein